MSIKLMSQIWDHSPAAGTDLLVLLYLADAANDDGYCWPSKATLARKARVGKRAVDSIVARLVAAGHITREPRFKSGIQGANLYRVIPPSSLNHDSGGDESRFRGGMNPDSGGDESRFRGGMNPDSGGDESRFRGGMNPDSARTVIRTIKETEENHQGNQEILPFNPFSLGLKRANPDE